MWIGKVERRKHDGGGGKRFQSPRVPRFLGPKVQGSWGPRYLKLKFKYELDSKEGPSCFYDNWFVRDENDRNLNNLFQKLVCSPSKVPISTRIILRNTINRSRMFNQLLLAQNIQISIIFLSVKSIIIEIKDSNHLSLTSNISAKTWSNWTCRGCFENVRTSRFQICPWFW